MTYVVSLRLEDKDKDRINRMSTEMKSDKSSAARELLREGWEHFWLLKYAEGSISIGKLSEALELNLGETMERLSRLGIKSTIKYDDYLESLNVL